MLAEPDTRGPRTAAACRPPASLAAAALAALTASCGSGTFGVFSAGSSSPANAAPTISSFEVLDTKLVATPSPKARIRLRVADAESDPANVRLFYFLGAPDEKVPLPLTQLEGVEGNTVVLATQPGDGIEHELSWSYPLEDQLPADASFVEEVTVFARVDGGVQDVVLGANGVVTGLGNDAPVVSDVISLFGKELGDFVALEFTVSDTSDDAVSVAIEYDVEGDLPDAGWRPIAAGTGGSNPAVQGQIASKGGTDLEVFWNSEADLGGQEVDVQVRFRPDDGVLTGANALTDVFRIDNNATAFPAFDAAGLLANPDGRDGIAIPLSVIDEESDDVQLVLQWRRPFTSFPDLPADKAGLLAALADPEQRRLLQIATPWPVARGGRVEPVGPAAVRLPELAGPASELLAGGLAGRELEILRGTGAPESVTQHWPRNLLNEPVAALSVGGGRNAIVLERPFQGAFGLGVVDLATGSLQQFLNARPVQPDRLAWEQGRTSFLVVGHIGNQWGVGRIALPSAANTSLVTGFSPDGGEALVNGVASLGTDACLLTVGDLLVRAEYADPAQASASVVLEGLAHPAGIALDPLRANHAWLAERDWVNPDSGLVEGRVLDVDLAARTAQPLPVAAAAGGAPGLPRPEGLLVEQGGARLLAVTDADPNDGTKELRALEPGGSVPATAWTIAADLPDCVGAPAGGADGMRLLPGGCTGELFAGGGLVQRRTIASYDPATRVATVSAPFQPAVESGQRWRSFFANGQTQGTPGGMDTLFVWDSNDLPQAGTAELRAVAIDTEPGLVPDTGVPKPLRGILETAPVVLGDPLDTAGSVSVVSADLDGDGDLDLALANGSSDNVAVFFRGPDGGYENAPLLVAAPGDLEGPLWVAAADLDGDGRTDLVTANAFSDNLTVFFQARPGAFDDPPLVLGGPATTPAPASVAAADLNGDDLPDLLVSSFDTDSLKIFFQSGGGAFDPVPATLGGPGVTDGPRAVGTADLDGDGLVDVFCGNVLGSTLTAFLQIADGDFESVPIALGDAATTAQVRWVTAADMDGDADLDLVSANLGTDTATIFFQLAPGSFDPQPLVLGGPGTTDSPEAVAPADVDGDGDLDLVTANRDGDDFAVFFQVAPGELDPLPAIVDGGPAGDAPHGLTVADLDGDGDLDTALANTTGDSLTVFTQPSPGSFDTPLVAVGSFVTHTSPTSVAGGDLDGDGDLDLAVAESGSDRVSVWFQTSPGTFSPFQLELGVGQAIGPRHVEAVDLDGDGLLDLVAADTLGNDVAVFFQTGAGVFDPTPLILGGTGTTDLPFDVAWGDLDGDGDLDLVVPSLARDRLLVFTQDAPGSFDPVPLELGDSSLTDGPVAVVVADLDGDGDRDVACANLAGHDLAVFRQQAPGAFVADAARLGGAGLTQSPGDLIAADLDGDGDLDLASANEGSDTLTIFLADRGLFDPLPVVVGGPGVGDQPTALAAADLDGDGDLDLVSANESGGNLTVFLQTTPGRFRDEPIVLGGGGATQEPRAVLVADVDRDGDPDVVSANAASNGVSVFFGNH